MANKAKSTLSIFLLIIISIFIFSFAYKIWRPVDFKEIKIEILNGCGVNDLAEDTSKFLRKKGFDVTFFGNAAEKQEKTVIIDIINPDKKWAKLVGNTIGVDRTSTHIDSSRCIHVLIILGMDYAEVLPGEILKGRLFGIQ